jgi:AcrR family transcriptional regulator
MATTREGPAKRKRPGGRSARVRSAVLKATVEELAQGGYASFSFEKVAERAGVHKTTLYRRWGDRESLLLEAMLELGAERAPIPETGSLRKDLLKLARAIASSIPTPEVQAIVRAVISVGDRDPKLAEVARRFWSTRIELDAVIVDRAIERGEVPPDVNRELVVEALLAPMYFRLLMTGGRLDKKFLERLASFVAAGAGAEPR